MTAQVIQTKRSTWSRLKTWAAANWLRYEIQSDEMWLAACVHDGIFDGDQVRLVQSVLAEKRVRLAVLEAA